MATVFAQVMTLTSHFRKEVHALDPPLLFTSTSQSYKLKVMEDTFTNNPLEFYLTLELEMVLTQPLPSLRNYFRRLLTPAYKVL